LSVVTRRPAGHGARPVDIDDRWHGIPLAELVQRELAPYATASNTQIEGPDVILSAEAGQAIAMVFHELATNAAKFGALSAVRRSCQCALEL
jgi:two-component sensor histidine kinase